MHQRKPQACSFDVALKSIEDAEYPVEISRIDSRSVVPDVTQYVCMAILRAHLDAGLPLCAHELDRVLDQVLNDLQETYSVAEYIRKIRLDIYAHSALDNAAR